MSSSRTDAQRWLDGVAIAASFACMVHCLAFPVVFALLPAISRWLALPESFHFWVVLAAAPFSTFVLWRHSFRRGRQTPFIVGLVGLSLMVLALVLGSSVLEPIITSIGALVLAGAHVMNWRGRLPCHD